MEILTHYKRELFQAIWDLLPNDQFMDVYENGIVIRCADGILQSLPLVFLIWGRLS